MSNIREYFNRQFQQLSFLNTSVKEEFLKLDESVKQNVELFSKFPKPIGKKFVKPSILETKKEIIQSKPTRFVQSDKVFLSVQKSIGQLEKRHKNTNQIISGKITIGNLKGLNFKSLFPQTQKISQSSLDYSARDSVNEVKLEQIKYMKDILELEIESMFVVCCWLLRTMLSPYFHSSCLREIPIETVSVSLA